MAEASNLAQRQMLQRKEFELNLEKESLELSTKIAVATAKDELLLDVETEGSDILSHTHSQYSYSKHSADVRPVISQATSLADDVRLKSMSVSVGSSKHGFESLLSARLLVWLMMFVLKVCLRWTSVFPEINQKHNQR